MIKGLKCTLRPIEERDLDFLAEMANHPDVYGNVVSWSFPVSHYGQKNWLDRIQGGSNSLRLMADDEDGNPIGLTGFWDIDWQARHALTAIKLSGKALAGRRGYGTDVVMTTFAYGFQELGLNRIWGAMIDFNAASLHLYVRKCGMRIEGRQREHVYRQGRYHDLLKVAIMRYEWKSHPLHEAYEEAVAPINIDGPVALQPDWLAPGVQLDGVGHFEDEE